MNKICLLLIAILVSTLSFGQLSGAYTINPDIPVSATNYQTWATAFTALNTQGVSAATTFTVTGTAATVTFAEGNLTLGGLYVGGTPQSALLTTLSATNTLSFTAGAGKTINMSGVGTGPTVECYIVNTLQTKNEISAGRACSNATHVDRFACTIYKTQCIG